MNDLTSQCVKHREIGFCALHPDPDQAESACILLQNIQGVLSAESINQHQLNLCYDIRFISLEMIEIFLSNQGFHIDNSLLAKLKRALYYYTDDTERANLSCCHQQDECTKKVFINQHQHSQHGCQDLRPAHWRRYL